MEVITLDVLGCQRVHERHAEAARQVPTGKTALEYLLAIAQHAKTLVKDISTRVAMASMLAFAARAITAQ